MMKTHTPLSSQQLKECICDHIVSQQSLDVRTGGSLIGLGRPMITDAVLCLEKINEVVLYEPEELVITLQPGVKVCDLKNLLARHNQELKFEPPDYGPMMGNHKNMGTMGGIIGANLSGPKRFMGGAVRDHVLGIEGVSGFGKIFKAGGRVVKNVSGYDVSKLITGSMGTLGVLSEFTLKLAPKAETELTIAIDHLNDGQAIKIMSRIASSPYEPSGLAHLPELINQKATTYIRIEGSNSSMDERKDAILKIIKNQATTILEKEESLNIWQQIRDVEPLNPPQHIPLWRICAPVTDMVEIITIHKPDFYYLDWAGGMLWLSTDHVPTIKNGAFWLMRSPKEKRQSLPFNDQKDPVTAALLQRIKKSFDPKNILNPNRMGF